MKSIILISFYFMSTSFSPHIDAKSRSQNEVRRVSRGEIVAALRTQTEYDITATTNGGRMQAGVFLELVRRAQESDPERLPLLIDYRDSFEAYLEATGLTIDEAPAFVVKPYQHEQNQLIDYRMDRVIKEVKKGPQPNVAVNVKAYWPDREGLASSFSYLDTLSSPHLKVTNQRVITFRLLYFDDMVLFDEIRGVSGRPTSGVLGMIFKAIGDASMVQSRVAISNDGLQVAYAVARKLISIATIVTISPDGKAQKDIPDGRPDLKSIEKRLKKTLRIKYLPFDFSSN